MYFLQLPSLCFPSKYFVMLRKCKETLANLWPIMLPYRLCRPTQYLSVAVTSTCLSRPFLLHALVKKPDSKPSTLMGAGDTSHWYKQKFWDVSLKRKRWPFHITFFLLSTNHMEVMASALAIFRTLQILGKVSTYSAKQINIPNWNWLSLYFFDMWKKCHISKFNSGLNTYFFHMLGIEPKGLMKVKYVPYH